MNIYKEIDSKVNDILNQVLTWRKEIHQHPEMANMEFKTSAKVKQHLNAIGVDEVYDGLAGGTGVIGILHGVKPGPTVGLRADMDALAVKEQTGLSFASHETCKWGEDVIPVMHACGHDVHTSMLMGAASILCSMRDRLCGKIMFIFQPAEEGPSPNQKGAHGAEALLKEEVFQNNKPDAMFAMHVDPKQPIGTAGELAFKAGQTCMAISGFDIVLTGVGGHNAKPWQGKDTILPGVQIMEGLQHIVTRNVNPATNHVVLTIGRFDGGTKYNVIADKTVIRGACRFSDYKTREYLQKRIEDVAKGCALAGDVHAEVQWNMYYPPNFNDEKLMKKMVPQLEQAIGVGHVSHQPDRCDQIPDDFSFFTLQIPSIYAMLSAAPDQGDPAIVAGLHMPNMMVNEKCIPNGIKSLVAFAATYADAVK